MPADDLAAVRLAEVIEGLYALERSIIRDLERAMKAHPLGPWVQRQRRLGPKQTARLLAAIGDPCWNDAEEQQAKSTTGNRSERRGSGSDCSGLLPRAGPS